MLAQWGEPLASCEAALRSVPGSVQAVGLAVTTVEHNPENATEQSRGWCGSKFRNFF